MSIEAWHWTGGTLRDGSAIPAIGEPLVHAGALEPCESGLHASVRLLDALAFAPGPVVEFKAPKRSLEQNARLWAMLGEISAQVVWYGAKLTPADRKDVFSASLRKARVVPTIDGDGFVPLGMRTSDMSKAEFGALMDLIEAFAAERGVMLMPAPTEAQS